MRASRGLFWPTIFAVFSFVLLILLGVWQLQRLAWKEDLIAKIEARAKSPPQALPPPAQWPSLAPADYDYRHVTLSGSFLTGRDALVFRGSANAVAAGGGPGYFVMTPFLLSSGGTVIVNRGFVPLDRKNEALLPAASPSPSVTLSGLMRPPEERNLFTPADKPEKGEFFTRDPALIASALQADNAAPFSIDLDPEPHQDTTWPRPGTTEISFPNNHLSYALTWFGLAIGLLLVFLVFVWNARKGAAA
ncbi:SURF1 family protein [Beijerinckia indica]|uniref:SURF1-like protein n=1 Tax=Beijerinckia indica subsp. indica (strain ATCC 9039 / DSM 1715 / NCIMB 8712) TaxID=395963 RepID=B2IGJ1_BEII9|nr:SURF1 family protein [Beijerinckia indica]ACB94373.1 Surfeit locus 1 family protein [Beijerinckia indica subsp. indica ATCC 9039]